MLTGRHFQICWPATDNCGARFGNLFDNEYDEISESQLEKISSQRVYSDSINPKTKKVVLLNNGISRDDRADNMIIHSCGYVAFSDEGVDNWFPPPPDWYLDEVSCWYRRLRPCPEIVARVERIASTFDIYTIGVHIRRTDHLDAIGGSPLRAFVRRMESTVNDNSRTNFFLATDCPNVQSTMRQQFEDRIVVSPPSHQSNKPNELSCRATVRGMQDALVELLLLARTSHILGSYLSSFSHDGPRFAEIPPTVEIVGSE